MNEWIQTPWGRMKTLAHNLPLGDQMVTIKILEVDPGKRLSDQRHAYRTEHWQALTKGAEGEVQVGQEPSQHSVLAAGDRLTIAPVVWHRLSCSGDSVCQILEVSVGNFDELDIERRADDYGRQ